MLRHSKLFTSIDGPFKIIEKNVPPIFNVKSLRPYHGEVEDKSFLRTIGNLCRSIYNNQWKFGLEYGRLIFRRLQCCKIIKMKFLELRT